MSTFCIVVAVQYIIKKATIGMVSWPKANMCCQFQSLSGGKPPVFVTPLSHCSSPILVKKASPLQKLWVGAKMVQNLCTREHSTNFWCNLETAPIPFSFLVACTRSTTFIFDRLSRGKSVLGALCNGSNWFQSIYNSLNIQWHPVSNLSWWTKC